MPTGFKVRRGFILKTQKPPATARASCCLLIITQEMVDPLGVQQSEWLVVDRGEISFISTVNKPFR